jgi:hypothetical protein
MQICDRRHQTEAEPIPGSIAAVFKPVKPPEYVLLFREGDAGAEIPHFQDEFVVIASDDDRNLAAIAAMLESVIDKV